MMLNDFEREHRDEPVCDHCRNAVLKAGGFLWWCPNCGWHFGRRWKHDKVGDYYKPRYREGRRMLLNLRAN